MGTLDYPWGGLQVTYQAHTQAYVYRIDDPENVISSNWNNWGAVFGISKEERSMVVGTYDLWVIPGMGVLYIDAGRIAWDNEGNIISHTGHEFYGDLEDLCPLFAP